MEQEVFPTLIVGRPKQFDGNEIEVSGEVKTWEVNPVGSEDPE